MSFDTEIYHSNIFFCPGSIFPPLHFCQFQRHTADDSNTKKLTNLSTAHTHLYLLHKLSRATFRVAKQTPLHTHAYF